MAALIWNQPSFHGDSSKLSTNNYYRFDLYSNIDNVLTSTSDNSVSYRELRGSKIDIYTDKSGFNFSLPQAAYEDTNIFIKSTGKEILVNTTNAALSNRNTINDYIGNINIGSARKIRTGIVTPNGNILGDSGDIYMLEANGYTNIFYKYFGINTDTGWANISPLLNGPTIDRPTVNTIGTSYFDTDINRPIWWNGSPWQMSFTPAAAISDVVTAKTPQIRLQPKH